MALAAYHGNLFCFFVSRIVVIYFSLFVSRIVKWSFMSFFGTGTLYFGYESSTGRKEDGSRTAVQIIIPGLEIPRWLTYQSLGNSVSIELPPNWCSSKWMGLALCASFNAISSPSYAHEFGNPVKTFGLRARVIARDMITVTLCL
jgi:hypothetical protein